MSHSENSDSSDHESCVSRESEDGSVAVLDSPASVKAKPKSLLAGGVKFAAKPAASGCKKASARSAIVDDLASAVSNPKVFIDSLTKFKSEVKAMLETFTVAAFACMCISSERVCAPREAHVHILNERLVMNMST